MAARNRARYLAPVALVATIAGGYLIVHTTRLSAKSTAAHTPAAIAPARTARGKFAKTTFYTVQPGDSMTAIAAKTGVSLSTLEALNPHVNPNACRPASGSGCDAERRPRGAGARARRRWRALACRARAAAPASAHARPALSVRAAILVAASTGQRLYGVNAERELPIASTTKLMTALITLEHVRHWSQMFTEPDYYASPADSQIGLPPGERMSVHDLLLALMLPSADDAAEDLAYNVGARLGRALRRDDERRARASSA